MPATGGAFIAEDRSGVAGAADVADAADVAGRYIRQSSDRAVNLLKTDRWGPAAAAVASLIGSTTAPPAVHYKHKI